MLDSGGAHTKHSWKRTGLPGLGSTVRNLGLDTEEAISVDALACVFQPTSANLKLRGFMLICG